MREDCHLRLEDELEGVEFNLRRGGLHRLLGGVVLLLAERHGGRHVGGEGQRAEVLAELLAHAEPAVVPRGGGDTR